MAAKPLTQWLPKGGVGYVLLQGGIYLQDNLGNTIITNTGDNIVPNPYYVQGKYKTSWTVPAHS